MKDERRICTTQQTKPPQSRRWTGGFRRGGAAYIEAVPEEPAVPVGRLARLLVPPRDHVRDARGQRVRGPPEPQGGGAGVDHHDEVALYLLKAAQRARNQSEPPGPPGALPALPHPPPQAFKRPGPCRARPSGEGAAPGSRRSARASPPAGTRARRRGRWAASRRAARVPGRAPCPCRSPPRLSPPGSCSGRAEAASARPERRRARRGTEAGGPWPGTAPQQVPGGASAAPGRCRGWPRLERSAELRQRHGEPGKQPRRCRGPGAAPAKRCQLGWWCWRGCRWGIRPSNSLKYSIQRL